MDFTGMQDNTCFETLKTGFLAKWAKPLKHSSKTQSERGSTVLQCHYLQGLFESGPFTWVVGTPAAYVFWGEGGHTFFALEKSWRGPGEALEKSWRVSEEILEKAPGEAPLRGPGEGFWRGPGKALEKPWRGPGECLERAWRGLLERSP